MNEAVLKRTATDSTPGRRAPRIEAHRSRLTLAGTSSRPRATDAWVSHFDLLTPTDDRSLLIKAFIDLVRTNDHEPLSVAQAARELHVSVRTLQRYCSGEIRFPPRLIIDLARMVSITSEIQRTDRPLSAIADAHGFSEPSDMRRWFLRFVGIRPGLHREKSGGGRPCGRNTAGRSHICPSNL